MPRKISLKGVLGPADGAGDVAHFMENARADIKDESGFALDELIKVAEGHAEHLPWLRW